MSISFSQSPYCGNASAQAGIEGALIGFSNIIGLGGLVGAIPGMNTEQQAQQALQSAQTSLKNAQTSWNNMITNTNIKLSAGQGLIAQKMVSALTACQDSINASMDERISTNTLSIITLSILVFFLIIYDII